MDARLQSVFGADEGNCSGCGLCVYICPARSIQLTADERGFLVPEVSDSCVGCGKCVRMCPARNLPEPGRTDMACVARAKDQVVLRTATAGGVFVPLAETVFKRGGVAYGAAVLPDGSIAHIKCSTVREATRCAGSKYVQSDLLTSDIFSLVSENLEQGKSVVFSGLPCQTAAMRKTFGSADGLVLVDLVCHGVASPLAWRAYLKDRHADEPVEVSFRKKTYGYHFSTMSIALPQGTYAKSARLDPFLKGFFEGVLHRDICNECPFKGEARFSDLTIFDCSRYTDLTGRRDDGLGYTNVLINSPAGWALLQEARDSLWIEEASREREIELNGRMVSASTPRNSGKASVYEKIKSIGFDQAIRSLYPITSKDRLIEGVKGPLMRLGLLDWLREFKGRLVR